ncbi:MAG: carbohydrate kinase family protein [Limisphaerales bacterium]
MQKTVLAFGETLWDLLPSGPMLGGAPLNFAFRVHSLGDRGIIASRLGRDDPGRNARDQIAALGMDTRFLQCDEKHPTGTVRVTLDSRGNPDFFIVPEVAYDFVEATDALLEFAAAADCLCFGTLIQRTAAARGVLRQVLEAAGPGVKFLDINLRQDCHSRETIVESLARADVLKMNASEAECLAGLLEIPNRSLPDVCAALLEKSRLQCCVVTLGEQGVFAASANGDRVYLPGYAVKVVDTCGSGDALAAGFVHEYLRGRPLAECCDRGNTLGALVATQKGATTPITPADVAAFRQAGHQRVYEPKLRTYATD